MISQFRCKHRRSSENTLDKSIYCMPMFIFLNSTKLSANAKNHCFFSLQKIMSIGMTRSSRWMLAAAKKSIKARRSFQSSQTHVSLIFLNLIHQEWSLWLNNNDGSIQFGRRHQETWPLFTFLENVFASHFPVALVRNVLHVSFNLSGNVCAHQTISLVWERCH